MTKDDIIQFIKTNDRFYEFVDFRYYTQQQLLCIYERALQKKNGMQYCLSCDNYIANGNNLRNDICVDMQICKGKGMLNL